MSLFSINLSVFYDDFFCLFLSQNSSPSLSPFPLPPLSPPLSLSPFPLPPLSPPSLSRRSLFLHSVPLSLSLAVPSSSTQSPPLSLAVPLPPSVPPPLSRRSLFLHSVPPLSRRSLFLPQSPPLSRSPFSLPPLSPPLSLSRRSLFLHSVPLSRRSPLPIFASSLFIFSFLLFFHSFSFVILLISLSFFISLYFLLSPNHSLFCPPSASLHPLFALPSFTHFPPLLLIRSLFFFFTLSFSFKSAKVSIRR
ncbi:unnamed protein product [Acanthosepion pharaonis]|uniref:Uncharacterized protein n=1 Tax=Acanthosepion pharaonis TaxID=158019 RepID=A0A812EZL8_ACAPH|nr:unnamed protein product [Sepia pharaonis]